MRLLTLLLVALFAMPAFAAPPEEVADSATTLSAAGRAAFEAIRSDPAPEKLTRNSHYWVSNEYRHDLFLDAIKDVGGVHIGVGTDQNYLLAGWSRPKVLVLVDFDAYIGQIHQIYRVVFAHAETPEAFLSLWTTAQTKTVQGWIDEAYADDPNLKRIKHNFKVAQPIIWRRLRNTKRRYAKRDVSTFLTDAAQYTYLRDLWAKGNVFVMRGDLTGELTLRDIGAAVEKAGLKVGTLYMSNAEQYFTYEAAFRENIKALPFAERSVVLHTLAWGIFGFADGHYHYTWQTGGNFQAWMSRSRVKKLGHLLRRRDRGRVEGYSTVTRLPEDDPKPKVKKKRRRKKKQRKTPPQPSEATNR